MTAPLDEKPEPRACTPEAVLSLRGAAIADGRPDDAAALYEPDAVYYFAPGGDPLIGRDDIRGALAELAGLHPQLQNDVRRVVIAGDVAFVVTAWRLTGVRPDGRPVMMAATSTDVLRRRGDDSWGIAIDDPWGVEP
ncbi:YybH family protein [Nocardia sp. NPDC020380]|uniref:YybH family protein n=1 Tax=Nocardia sp. NPDC020380 TaxID=3364309 RepID=UPI003797B459